MDRISKASRSIIFIACRLNTSFVIVVSLLLRPVSYFIALCLVINSSNLGNFCV